MFRESHHDAAPNKEHVPELLRLKLVAENTQAQTEKVLVYIPPIMGNGVDAASLALLNQTCQKVYEIEIEKYAYPDFGQYTQQAKMQLESLTDLNRKNLVLLGFSQGTSLAARLGKELHLAPTQVLMVAPITSFRPSLARFAAWREARLTPNTPEQQEESYLRRLLGSPKKLYLQPDSRLAQLRALNLARTQWSTKSEDLPNGTVISGTKDFISLPGSHTSQKVDAKHTLRDFSPHVAKILTTP